jgi:hypothetical protein
MTTEQQITQLEELILTTLRQHLDHEVALEIMQLVIDYGWMNNDIRKDPY